MLAHATYATTRKFTLNPGKDYGKTTTKAFETPPPTPRKGRALLVYLPAFGEVRKRLSVPQKAKGRQVSAAAVFLIFAALLDVCGFMLLRSSGLSFWGMAVPFILFSIATLLLGLALIVIGDNWEARKRR